MKRIVCLFLMLCVPILTFGQAKEQQSASDVKTENELRDLVRAWDEAQVKHDAATLDRLLADEWSFVGGADKARYLASVKNTNPNFVVESQISDQIKVRVYGKTAILSGIDNVKGTRNGQAFSERYLYTDVWMKRQGRWQCVVTQSEKLALSNATNKNATLDERIRTEVAAFKGTVKLFAKNLDTGETYALGADDKVRTASTIKTAIMVEAFARVAEGKAAWSDEVVLTKTKKVSGSGVLQDLSDGLHLTLRDAVTLMITVSDNTATNLALDVLTSDAVNARMDRLGFKNTRSLRKVGGGGDSKALLENQENKKYGLGVTTPREMVTLLEKLERGEIISPQVSKEMIELLKREQFHDGIGRDLKGVQIASKPGALDALRSDVGIIYTKRGRIAMAITCDDMPEANWTSDNPALLMLARLSEILIDGLGK